MTQTCSILTLGEMTDQYLLFNGIDKRRYFKQYLFLSGEVWKDLFQNTLFVTKSVYVELKKGSPYNFVEIPDDSVRFFGLSVPDKCGNLKPLYYNDKINTLVKPTIKSCGCDACDCGGLCESIGSLIPTTKEVIINGDPYTETTWIKTCPNGDVMEYRTIPTLQYQFDRGSYDNSYDVSYEIGTSSSEVVTYTLSRKICKLEVAECGCPTQTKENECIIADHCGCYFNSLTHAKRKCEKHWGERNYYAGECVISDCRSKVFVKHVDHFDDNNWMVMSYQTNGINPDGQTQVPDYAKMALFTGMFYYKNLFNDRLNPRIKEAQKYSYMDEQNKIILFNNKFAIEDLESLPQMATW